MTDEQTTLDQLKGLVRAFAVERDWVQFHQPKDLGLALGSEVGELLDLFRFRSDAQIEAALATADGHQAIAHELADCLWAVLRLADVCRIDLASALDEKVRLASLKYPVDRAYGKNEKYTAYQTEEDRRDDLPGSSRAGKLIG